MAPHPRLSPLPAQKARLLAKALVPIQHRLPPGHRAAGTSRRFRAGPARRPSVAPLGLHHSGASPVWARARPSPPLTVGLMWRLPWGQARSGAGSDVSGARARLACFLALRHLLGSQTSSRLQRSPSERTKCSLASGAQVSVYWARAQVPGPSVAAQASILCPSRPPSLASLGQPPWVPHHRNSAWVGGSLFQGTGTQRSGAACPAEGKAGRPVSPLG